VLFEESRPDIADEKLPIGRSPLNPFAIFAARDPMKTDAMAGDEVEFSSQIGQRRLRMDSRDDPVNAKKLRCSLKERIFVGVQAESFVAEETAEVKKISDTAAQIENVKRRRAIEPQVLEMFEVDAEPVGCVFIGVDPSRVRPVGIMSPQPF